MSAVAVLEPATDADLPLKEWARRIAAQAPPPSDDVFAQVHSALTARAPCRETAEQLPQAA